jgi:CxxC motif-containing protein
MAEVTCIICPMGCRITVTETAGETAITGQGCRRGEVYAQAEVTAPKRVVTAVVGLKNRAEVLPVKTAAAIPKDKIFSAMDEIRGIEVTPPVKTGQILRKNLAGTGVALVATKNVGRVKN